VSDGRNKKVWLQLQNLIPLLFRTVPEDPSSSSSRTTASTQYLRNFLFLALDSLLCKKARVSTKVIFFYFRRIEIPKNYYPNFVEISMLPFSQNFDFDVVIGISVSISIFYLRQNRNSDKIPF
jgi:hypothetical protein